jgi:hypothetical protein
MKREPESRFVLQTGKQHTLVVPAQTRRRVYWSQRDAHDRDVLPEVMTLMQRIADLADVDLQLSSGYRAGDRGNHGKHLAVDINEINGVDVGKKGDPNPAAMPLVRRVQEVARSLPEVRENYGPAGLWKRSGRRSAPVLRRVGDSGGGNPSRDALTQLQYNHDDHVHISYQH